jgi:Transposase domain (DUF772)
VASALIGVIPPAGLYTGAAVYNRRQSRGFNPFGGHRLLAALWIYAYSEGVNAARELTRMCSYEPGCQWLTGMEEVNHHTLSDFRAKDKEAQDDLFQQLLGVLSAEGLTDLKRVLPSSTMASAPRRLSIEKASFWSGPEGEDTACKNE